MKALLKKLERFKKDYIYNLRKDDGTSINIKLIDKQQIHNNTLQVIHQYEVEGTYKKHL